MRILLPLAFVDLKTKDSSCGLRFESGTNFSGARNRIAYIDADEVAGLVDAMVYIKNQVSNTTPLRYTEYKFFI